nr:hypothetical protein B11C_110074 [Bartonella sp. 1-1C]
MSHFITLGFSLSRCSLPVIVGSVQTSVCSSSPNNDVSNGKN